MQGDLKSCDNCGFNICREIVFRYYTPNTEPCSEWKKLPCPRCGGALSTTREHNGRKYRHCYSCHKEFYLEEENG